MKKKSEKVTGSANNWSRTWIGTLLFAGMALMLTGNTLLVTPSTYRATDFKLPFSQSIVLALAAGLAIFLIREGRPLLTASRQRRLALILALAWLGINLCSAAQSNFPWSNAYRLIQITTNILLFWLIVQWVERSRTALRLLQVLVWLSAPVCLYALAQGMGYDIFSGGIGVISTFGNANFLAGFLVVVIPLTILMALLHAGQDKKQLVLHALLLILQIVALGLSRTRGAWIAVTLEFSLMLFLLIIRHRRQHDGHSPKRLILGGVLLLLLALGILPLINPDIIDRVRSLANPENFDLRPRPEGVKNSIQVRLYIWQGALKLFRERPFLGHGPGTFMPLFPAYRPAGFHSGGLGHNSYHAHCEYLEILSDTGLAGLAVFLALLAYILIQLPKRMHAARTDRLFLTLGCTAIAAIGLLVHSAFTVDLRFTSGLYLWLLLGILVALTHPESETPATGQLRKERAILIGIPLFAIVLTAIWFCWLPARASLALKRGILAEQAGKPRLAAENDEDAVKILPCYAPAAYRLGSLRRKYFHYSRGAAKIYRHLLQYAPNYGQTHYNLGLVYRDLKQYPDAIHEFTRATELNPYLKNAYFYLGLACHEAKRNADAERALLRALELKPDDSKINATARDILLDIYYREKRWKNAIRIGTEQIRKNPKRAAAYSSLGVIYAQSGAPKKAEKLLRQAVEMAPSSPTNLGNLQLFLQQRHRRAEAAAIGQRIQKLRRKKNVK